MTKLKVVAVALGIFASGAGLFGQQEGGTARKPGGAALSVPKGPSPIDPATRTLIEARLAAAREVYGGEMARIEQMNGLPPDDTPMWSRRWMGRGLSDPSRFPPETCPACGSRCVG